MPARFAIPLLIITAIVAVIIGAVTGAVFIVIFSVVGFLAAVFGAFWLSRKLRRPSRVETE